jgi:outer membrane protein assembly factor BamB
LCLDAKTGKVLWTKTALEGKPRLETHRDNTYASETPVSDGKYVVAYFGMMGLFCYDLDGALIWKKDLGLHPMAQDWGTSSSPTILDEKVFVQVDNEESSFVVAIDIETGDEVWRQAREERSNWGSAIIWENSHRKELVTGGAIVRSYDPNTGNLLWQVDISNGGLNATPTASGDLLVVGRSGRGGTSFFAIRSGTDEQLAAARIEHRQQQKNDAAPKCPQCGKIMTLRTAKGGKTPGSQFWGCMGYPECKGTAPV